MTFVPYRSWATYSHIPIWATRLFNPEIHSPSGHRQRRIWNYIKLEEYCWLNVYSDILPTDPSISFSFSWAVKALKWSGPLSVHTGMSGIYFLPLITVGLHEGLGILGQLPYILYYLWTTWQFNFCFWTCLLDLLGMKRFLSYSGSGAHIRSMNSMWLLVPLISGTRNAGSC